MLLKMSVMDIKTSIINSRLKASHLDRKGMPQLAKRYKKPPPKIKGVKGITNKLAMTEIALIMPK